MSAHRTQCAACPWRDVDTEVPADVQAHAREHPDRFVCHTRCGPCPGPRLALQLTAGAES